MSLADSLIAGSIPSSLSSPHGYIAIAAFFVSVLVVSVLVFSRSVNADCNGGIFTYLKFAYANFLKPHEKGGNGQQQALESFYKTQVPNLIDLFR